MIAFPPLFSNYFCKLLIVKKQNEVSGSASRPSVSSIIECYVKDETTGISVSSLFSMVFSSVPWKRVYGAVRKPVQGREEFSDMEADAAE